MRSQVIPMKDSQWTKAIQARMEPFFGNERFYLQWKHLLVSKDQDIRELEKKWGAILKKKMKDSFLSPLPFVSLSHTWDGSELWFFVLGATIPIGVDLEKKNRKVYPKLKDRICSFLEKRFHLGVLEYWVLKEASFKVCFPNNQYHLLMDYEIVHWNAQTQSGRVHSKYGVEIQVALFSIGPWWIGLAKKVQEVDFKGIRLG